MDRGISEDAVSVILSSWRASTKTQYLTYIKKWINFSKNVGCDIFTSDVHYCIEFLNSLFNIGFTYSAINTARSAISVFLGVTSVNKIGTHPLIIRFMKGVAVQRPSQPRYDKIWDVRKIFNVFRGQPLAEFLTLYDLSLRTAILLALVSAQRGQSLHLLDIDKMETFADKYVFHVQGFKHSRVGCDNLRIVLPLFVHDTRLCIFHTLTAYLDRTKDLRKSSKLFISTVKPYQGVSKDTISRWIHSTMRQAGIDVSVFRPHSTRAAAVSAARRKGVELQHILDKAGWSNEETFAMFYNKPLVQSDDEFAGAILKD